MLDNFDDVSDSLLGILADSALHQVMHHMAEAERYREQRLALLLESKRRLEAKSNG